MPVGLATGVSSDPVLVGRPTGYEINGPADVEAGAQVLPVRDVQRRALATATPLADAAIPAPFGIHSRAEWGARVPVSTSYGSTIKMAIVHHSVTTNNYSPADVPGIIRNIQAYHMDAVDRQYADIAYNFVVDKYGGIWEGRGGGIDAAQPATERAPRTPCAPSVAAAGRARRRARTRASDDAAAVARLRRAIAASQSLTLR